MNMQEAVDLVVGEILAEQRAEECACLVQEDAAGNVVVDEKCEEHRS